MPHVIILAKTMTFRRQRFQAVVALLIAMLTTVPVTNFAIIYVESTLLRTGHHWMGFEWPVSAMSGALGGLLSLAVLMWRISNSNLENRIHPILVASVFYGLCPLLMHVAMKVERL